MANFARIEHI